MQHKTNPTEVGLTVNRDGTATSEPPSAEIYSAIMDGITALEDLASIMWERKEQPNTADHMSADDYEWRARDLVFQANRLRGLIRSPGYRERLPFKTYAEIFGDSPTAPGRKQ